MKLSLLLGFFLLCSAACTTMPESLPSKIRPKKYIHRPFTLPKGLGLWGLAFSASDDRLRRGQSFSVDEIIDYEYGISENSSLRLFGYKYQLLYSPKRVLGFSFGSRRLQVFPYTVSKFRVNLRPTLEIFYRENIFEDIAMEITAFADEEFQFKGQDRDPSKNEIRRYLQLAVVYQLRDALAIAPYFRIQYVENFGSDNSLFEIPSESNAVSDVVSKAVFWPIGLFVKWSYSELWESDLELRHNGRGGVDRLDEWRLFLTFRRYN